MSVEVDARGLPCPRPVVETRKALQDMEEGNLTVLVDRSDSSENVQRFAGVRAATLASPKKMGYTILKSSSAVLPSAGLWQPPV